MKRWVWFLAAGGLWTCGAQEPGPDFRQVHESVYNTILIEQNSGRVVLSFRKPEKDVHQAAMDIADPLRPTTPSAQGIFAAAFVQGRPEKALLLGLGGAEFNRLFHAAYPEATVKSFEIDPLVVELAEKFMGYRPSGRELPVIGDARYLLKRDQTVYDWIVCDAFLSAAPPGHLRTAEFFHLVSRHLRPGGVFVCNLLSRRKLFENEVATIRQVFPQVALFPASENWNTIVLAVNEAEPSLETLIRRFSPEEAPALLREKLDLKEIQSRYEPGSERKLAPARVLTDDFAPTEYLGMQFREIYRKK
jgi:SAM-dependent methyltransferase